MPTFGRKVIYTDKESVTRENLLAVLKDAFPIHAQNEAEIRHLRAVYRGNQAVLGRTKDVRPEINNKCVLNHANEIVSFKVSYLLSEPIVYINRGVRDASASVNKLNEYMHLEGKPAKDKEIADDFNICGVAYRMVLVNPRWPEVDAAPFKMYTLAPEDTFLVRSNALGHEVLCAAMRIWMNTGIEMGIASKWCVYTPNAYFEVDDSGILVERPHGLGCVPIFEYVNNKARLGSFEIVETLLDAMNTLESNRLDATEQIVQALMIFKNCDIDSEEFEKLRQSGAIKISASSGTDADVKLLCADMQQQDQQVLMDSLYKTILTITGMPAQSSENKSDSSNNGAVFMRAGWYSADARAKDSELLWKRSETKFLRLILKICNEITGLGLKLVDVGMKFTRRNYEDILSKSQTLRTLLEAGIHPKFAIAQCGLFGDPTEVYEASMPYLEKWTAEPEADAMDGKEDDSGDGEDMV